MHHFGAHKHTLHHFSAPLCTLMVHMDNLWVSCGYPVDNLCTALVHPVDNLCFSCGYPVGNPGGGLLVY